MHRKTKHNFKWIIAALTLVLLVGCATIGEKIDTLSLGATEDEVDHILRESKYTVVARQSEPDGAIEVRRYGSYSDTWDLTFKDGKLIGWKKVPQQYYAYPPVGVGIGVEEVIGRH